MIILRLHFAANLTVLSIFLSLTQTAQTCLAQEDSAPAAPPQASVQHATSQQRSARPFPKELSRERLAKWPATVPVALPPDSKFMSGYRSQYTSTKPVTEIRFKTANKLSVLNDWYQKTLAGTGWTIGPSTADRLQVYKGNITCTLTFIESANAVPVSTTVWLNYSGDR